jgi:cyclopropane fatty-acyl-phospholipid synthase-like methyltransferase
MPKASNTRSSKSARLPRAVVRDRYTLYQLAVQSPDAEIDFVDKTFKKLRGRHASRLREDFCGTGYSACEWIRRRPNNTAIGLDLDPVPLKWGRANNLAALTEAQQSRIELVEADVLSAPKAALAVDAILAMNFSYWIFQTRPLLRSYFEAARRALNSDGVLFMDCYGGWEASMITKERRRVGNFTYIWEQESFNPITGEMHCKIHFQLSNKRWLKNAFTYTWRLWTIPELRELLLEAGFKNVTAYWEGDDGKGGGNGVFRPTTNGESCPAWIAYLVASK